VKPEREQVEMELRALGRRQARVPTHELMERVQAAAHAEMDKLQRTSAAIRQRNFTTILCFVLLLVLPLPALFLWLDWAAVSSLLARLLPPSASGMASVLYFWLKIGSLVAVYGMLLPGIGFLLYRNFKGWMHPVRNEMIAA
jgi:hypothetical protein